MNIQIPVEFTPAQIAWLAALESGNYLQTNGTLHKDGGYCCLGLACEVSNLAGWEYDNFYLSARSTLPDKVRIYFNFFGFGGNLYPLIQIEDKLVHTLIHLNDSVRFSFLEIATFVRNHPRSVFYTWRAGLIWEEFLAAQQANNENYGI